MTRKRTAAGENDEGLVERARRGDPTALDQLVSRHNELAWRVARGIVHDDDAAADAVQDAFLRAFRNLDGFRGEARFRTWLLSIVMNEARAIVRRRVRRRESELDRVGAVPDGAAPIDGVVVMRDEARRARAMVGRLPDKQRMAVTLRIDEGLAFREIGEIIGSSEGAARVNYHHGIRRLRELMSE